MSNLKTRLHDLLLDAWHSVYYVFGEGSWSLRTHERKVLDAALGFLAEDIQSIVALQLGHRYFIERTNKHINILRFHRPDEVPTIPESEFADLLLRVRIVSNGKREFAHVTFYKGRVFSIEFKKPGKVYARNELEVIEVTLGKPSQSHTRGLDRAEHGREE